MTQATDERPLMSALGQKRTLALDQNDTAGI